MKFVITGGPGVGKTTTIVELLNRGHLVVPESARSVISEQLPNGILPWTDLHNFQLKVFERQISLESRISGFAFCDRGVCDSIAYCNAGNIKVPSVIADYSARNRYAGVFVLDRLPVYETDSVRREDVQLAEKLHHLLIDAYKSLGYEIIRVPVLPPAGRVDFILNEVKL